jgi:hypothetical protein
MLVLPVVEIKKYKSGVVCSGIALMPNFMKIFLFLFALKSKIHIKQETTRMLFQTTDLSNSTCRHWADQDV